MKFLLNEEEFVLSSNFTYYFQDSPQNSLPNEVLSSNVKFKKQKKVHFFFVSLRQFFPLHLFFYLQQEKGKTKLMLGEIG